MSKKGDNLLADVEKPEWCIGEEWVFKTFTRSGAVEGFPLQGTMASRVTDKGNISVDGKEQHEAYMIHVAKELVGENERLKIVQRTKQTSYIRCSDLSMLLDIAHDDITLIFAGRTNIIAHFRVILHRPPVVPFNFPMAVGKKWSFSVTPIGIMWNTGDSFEKMFRIVNFHETFMEFECVEMKSIPLPAREYPCIVIRVKAKNSKENKETKLFAGDAFCDYFSPEVGYLVMSEEYIGGELMTRHELISHTRGSGQ